jgi:protein TonB
MFEDFHPAANSEEQRKRMATSMASAVVLYGSIFIGGIAATAATRHVIEEEETQVEFAPPPEPEPPPPPPPVATPAVAAMRPKASRPKLTPPDKVNEKKLEESNKELATADSAGPVDGFLDGVEGGQGNAHAPPPPPPPPKAAPTAPVGFPSNYVKPRYSPKARRKGIEGVVVVSYDVMPNGTVANVRVVSGAPELAEMVMGWVPKWRFKPATRDGKPIPWRKTDTIRFRLDDA